MGNAQRSGAPTPRLDYSRIDKNYVAEMLLCYIDRNMENPPKTLERHLSNVFGNDWYLSTEADYGLGVVADGMGNTPAGAHVVFLNRVSMLELWMRIASRSGEITTRYLARLQRRL